MQAEIVFNYTGMQVKVIDNGGKAARAIGNLAGYIGFWS